ncbi:MAG TPA: formylglycine-generating enzyme family protein [Anaerolineales bacterium]|nr:formylglycine-generating enzyme family protein [Anaerolineales bacterium]
MRSSVYRFIVIAFAIAIALSGCAPLTNESSESKNLTITRQTNLEEIGRTKTSTVDNVTLVYVPAGEFLMGTADGLTDEQPVHKVHLDAYWLDQTEVTNAMYAKCVEAGKCDNPSFLAFYDDPAFASHPVEYVSWNDAVEYCTWTGRRLPTEAEWEKAAAWDPYTDQQRVYPWGNEYDCRKGNFDDETELDDSLMQDGKVSCDGFVRSAPVGSFPEGASSYGALDLGGNVWEWVHDAFIEVDPFNASIQNYYAVSPLENPQGVDPAITEYRSMRGGSYNFTFGYGRSAYRLWFGLDDSYEGVGFRCALSE